MTDHVYEYGKRWRVEVPRTAVKRKMASLHVRTTAAEIADMVSRAISTSDDRERYTPTISRQTLRYALLCHERNLRLYQQAMGKRP